MRVSGQEGEVWEAEDRKCRSVLNRMGWRHGGKDWIYDSVVQHGVQMSKV